MSKSEGRGREEGGGRGVQADLREREELRWRTRGNEPQIMDL